MCGGKGTPPNCKLCCKLYLSLSHGNLPWLPIAYGRKAMLLSETCRVHLLSPFSCPPHPLPSWITCNTSDTLCFLLSTWVHICSSILTGKFFSCLSLWGCRQLHCWSPLLLTGHSTILCGQLAVCCWVIEYMVRSASPEKINPLPFFFQCGLIF